jgi:hypothetical protein
MVLEHYRWTEDCLRKTVVKSEQHSNGIKGSVKWRDRNVVENTEDFQKKLKKEFRPKAWTLKGWMDYGDFYRWVAEQLPEGGTFVELGVWTGRSLSYMGEYLTLLGKKATLVGYDQFNPQYYLGAPRKGMTSEEWCREVQETLASHCPWLLPKVVWSDSADAAKFHEDGSVSAIWFDAGHGKAELLRDLEAWRPKIAEGGIMAGHDLGRGHPGVEKALKEFGIKYRPVSKSSWVAEL